MLPPHFSNSHRHQAQGDIRWQPPHSNRGAWRTRSPKSTARCSWSASTLAKELYGIEITKVREIILITEITRIPETPDFLKGLINLRSTVIPVIDLRVRFGLPEAELSDESRIMVLQACGKTIGIMVDAVSEVLRVKHDQIAPPPPTVAGLGPGLPERPGEARQPPADPPGHRQDFRRGRNAAIKSVAASNGTAARWDGSQLTQRGSDARHGRRQHPRTGRRRLGRDAGDASPIRSRRRRGCRWRAVARNGREAIAADRRAAPGRDHARPADARHGRPGSPGRNPGRHVRRR